MQNTREILSKYDIVPILKLVTKKPGGGTEGTGPHAVKLLKDEVGLKLDYMSGLEIDVVWYHFEEDGVHKKYAVPIKTKTGDVHYLLQRLVDFEEGDTVILEYIRKPGTAKGYIDVRSPGHDSDEIPVIESDENDEIDFGEVE